MPWGRVEFNKKNRATCGVCLPPFLLRKGDLNNSQNPLTSFHKFLTVRPELLKRGEERKKRRKEEKEKNVRKVLGKTGKTSMAKDEKHNVKYPGQVPVHLANPHRKRKEKERCLFKIKGKTLNSVAGFMGNKRVLTKTGREMKNDSGRGDFNNKILQGKRKRKWRKRRKERRKGFWRML